MSSNPSILVQGVSKLFRKQNQRTFKELLPALFSGKKPYETFWALKNVSFSVEKGETVGIIGPNGSGKSTLLKLLAGVSYPTRGTLKVNGRIAPLIELGAGFHPELTGRENVFLNGVILGMKRAEIKEKFQKIVDFAEIEEHVDQPIKHYSSGMYLRLAFAIAIFTEPDILLIDEILAVGDEQFQRKCFARIKEMKQQGVTLLLISHSMEQVKKMSDRVVFLKQGEVIEIGEPEKVVKNYLETIV